jgi:hypothetical protein
MFIYSSCFTPEENSHDSAVGIATGYGLEDQRFEFESRWRREFSLLHVVQTGSEANPASYPMGTGGSFLRGKADHSPPTSAEIKKTWVYTSTHPYVFMAKCLIS